MMPVKGSEISLLEEETRVKRTRQIDKGQIHEIRTGNLNRDVAPREANLIFV